MHVSDAAAAPSPNTKETDQHLTPYFFSGLTKSVTSGLTLFSVDHDLSRDS